MNGRLKECAAALLLALSSLPARAGGRIAVTYITPPLNVPSMVEKRLGLFAKHFGQPVEYVVLRNGPEQAHALAAGDVQFLPAAGSTNVFLSVASGAPFRILGIFARSPQSFKILAPKGSPLTCPEDLRGKTVAGPRGTILHELLALWLAGAGMTVNDVNFVSMNVPAAAAALAAGRVDAALVTGVPAWRMARDGYTVLRDGDGLVGGEVLSVTTEAMLRDHPDLVEKFLAARRETLRWIADHRGEAVRIAAEELDLSREDVEAQLPLYDFSMEITPADAAGLQRTVDFMAAQGMMERAVDVRSLFAAPRP